MDCALLEDTISARPNCVCTACWSQQYYVMPSGSMRPENIYRTMEALERMLTEPLIFADPDPPGELHTTAWNSRPHLPAVNLAYLKCKVVYIYVSISVNFSKIGRVSKPRLVVALGIYVAQEKIFFVKVTDDILYCFRMYTFPNIC
jgi:hypothetical protein